MTTTQKIKTWLSNSLLQLKLHPMNFIIIVLLLLFCVDISNAQNSNRAYVNPDNPISAYGGQIVYMNLAAGNIDIMNGYQNVKYYEFDSNGVPQKRTLTADSDVLYYIYMAQPNSGYGPSNLPVYAPVTTTSGGSLEIVNATDVRGLIDQWNETVASNNAGLPANQKRFSTPHKIYTTCVGRLNICLDNIWSTYQNYDVDPPYSKPDSLLAALAFYPNPGTEAGHCELNVYLKGDNRLGQVLYGSRELTNSHIIFRSAEGNGEISGTLLAADIDPDNQTWTYYVPNYGNVHVPYNRHNAVIGGTNFKKNSRGIEIKGGTIFAGGVYLDNCTAIGAGSNGFGEVTIDGGQVTAVCSSTGAAIGGGMGWTSYGGAADVTINGGNVYAYNFGYAWQFDEILRFVPSTAIGGGSSYGNKCNPCTVTINGGNVYSQSIGGVTMGGGGSGMKTGGDGNVYINGGNVTAKSLPGTITAIGMPGNPTIDVPAGAAIGGGTGGTGTSDHIAYGGSSVVTITDGNLYAGSVGGGFTNDERGKIGSATVFISGGVSQAQFIMAGGSTSHCSYTQTNGTVQNSNTSSTEFILLKPDGGAVWMDDPLGEASISGGVIRNCSATNGGAIYMTGGSFEITGGTVGGSSIANGNKATSAGGAVYMGGGTFTMKGGYINYNTATNSNGGGVYIAPGGTVTINGGTILGNQALNGDGGGFYVNPGSSKTTTINSNSANTVISGNKAKNGGGAFVNSGTLTVNATSSRDVTIQSNTSSINGGGVYVNNGTVTFANAKLLSNVATNNDGGGFFLGSGSISVSGSGTAISGNTAKSHGGGVYVGGGGFSMTSGTIGGTLSQGNKTTGNTSYGGGLYMGGGTATISGGSISGNQTDNNGMGGAIYMNGGTCTLSNGTTIGGASTDYANSAKYGGGIYSANGSITVEGGIIGYNSAVKGGGIYTNGNKAKVYVQKDSSKADDPSYIEHNTAQYGGGIYGEKGLVEFSDGFIRYNTASEQGGGIYVDANDTLYLKGSANMLLNGVPTDHKGGGVYLVGSLIVGEQTSTLGTILAQDNYAYTTTQPDTLLNGGHVVDSLRNNVYLPNPVVHEYGESTHAGVIEVVENGISNESHVGFSVPHGNVPVIYCIRSSTSWGYLHHFSTGQTLQFNLFDDSGRYKSVHYSNDPAFNPDHVYLYGFWSDEVTGEGDEYCDVDYSDFVDQDTIYISNPCQLAFFISWVNGRETPAHLDAHPNVCAKLMDDIDMHEFGWVPIGTVDNAYSGVFDGNGHTVSGIRSLLNEYHTNYGFFGNLADGAVVKNLFVKGASFHIESKELYTGTMYIGGVAGLTNGNATIDNCEAESVIVVEPDNTNTVMGGLVGKTVAGDQIKSSIGIADMTGFLMGGLAGQNNGSILNSFSNAKFTKAVSSHTQYMGGLVGDNEGLVENCYSRVRVPVPATNYFGYLVGDNDGGTVKYSYAALTDYTVSGKEGTLEGLGTYGITQLPYLYKHRDTQVAPDNRYVPTGTDADKQMMNVLNNWVDQDSLHRVTYTKWGRPWQVSDAQKPLNDDYPILKMPVGEAVAAKAADPYLYYGTVDNLMASYTEAGSAIWLYRNPADLVRGDNSGSSAKLYIAEDVALKNLNELKAYVGITLDNSAGAGGANPTYGSYVGIETDETDWHMISTPLSDAHVGINYQNDNTAYDFSWGHPTGMPYYRFYPKDDENNGYFPSHRFGEDYPSTSATIEAGNYYNEWDFYSYSEPNYHWINFKRNKASHHYFDIEQHPNLTYTNEELMVPGRGYFAATREETFLQCQGHLNAAEVTYGLTHTSGVPRHGYNLIGNPFQAYLDFDAFADDNWGDDVDVIWGEGETPSYTILDEDYLEMDTNVETLFGDTAVFYKTFSYGCSSNPDVSAGGFIHPHQGFFVRLGDDKTTATAHFEPDQRNITAKSKFRGAEHIDYPLVNLFAIEENGAADVVTVELGRPDQGGAAVMQSLRVGNGKIWCHYNEKDYAIAYTQPGISEVAIRFESVNDTEYTMRWSTRNGDFSYLHLIDNKTGADVDCLTTDEYRFSASTSDYKSRFRLVFGYTGIEEPEAEANENFAFMMNEALVVTGEGVLQVFDMTGRMVASQELHGVQTTVSLPNAANGVYVLRLTEGKQSRIQKMVISK